DLPLGGSKARLLSRPARSPEKRSPENWLHSRSEETGEVTFLSCKTEEDVRLLWVPWKARGRDLQIKTRSMVPLSGSAKTRQACQHCWHIPIKCMRKRSLPLSIDQVALYISGFQLIV